MPQTCITPDTMLAMADEMARLVVDATGWQPIPGPIHIQIMPAQQGYQYLVREWIDALRLENCRENVYGLSERLVDLVGEEGLLANYLPHIRELLVIPENGNRTQLEGLRLAVVHELVHRSQSILYPEIFEQIDHLTRMILCAYFESPGSLDLYEFIQTIKELNILITLVESHAAYIQASLAWVHKHNTRSLPHCNLPGLLFRLLGENKSSRHISGLPAVAEAAAAGNMDALFRYPGKFIEIAG